MGRIWLERLASHGVKPVLNVASVLRAEILLNDERATAFAVVPDASSTLPRARHGELGLEQALALAAGIEALLAEDEGKQRRSIVAVVDTPGQAFGSFEERRCLSVACACAVQAYANARRAGHPILTLVVGGAVSGSFLAHGMQADAILALADESVRMYAMSPRSTARITRRTLAEVERIASRVLPASYAIADAHKLGIIDTLLPNISAASPSNEDVLEIKRVLSAHLQAIRSGRAPRRSVDANPLRATTQAVCNAIASQWAAADRTLEHNKLERNR